MSNKALYSHDYLHIPQIFSHLGCSCNAYRHYGAEEGARWLPHPSRLREFTNRIQDSTESHDHRTRESDEVVSMGLDHRLSLYGAQ